MILFQFIYEWPQSLDVCWGATNYHGNETTHGPTPALLHFHNQPTREEFHFTFFYFRILGIFCLSCSLAVLGRSCDVSFYISHIFCSYFPDIFSYWPGDILACACVDLLWCFRHNWGIHRATFITSCATVWHKGANMADWTENNKRSWTGWKKIGPFSKKKNS